MGRHRNAWLDKIFERYQNMDDRVYSEAKRLIKKLFDIE